ncbi:MAG: hypothetical protein IJS13_04860 [Paludibacteraceae bacterium]|nr:hypothetical protein [Paludibacteraceae bacterium]
MRSRYPLPYLCCLLVLTLVVLSGCELDKECRQDMRVRVGLRLTGDSLRLSADSITYEHVQYNNVGPMTIHGIGSDSLLADSADVSSIYLPLRKDADSSMYAIEYDGETDTLTITYSRQETFVSLACGCAVFATIDTAYCTTTNIDSIKIANSNVTTQQETHIEVFVHKE